MIMKASLRRQCMDYKQIIGEAWNFTQENKKLIVWYAFIPSTLGTLVGVIYLIYQFFAFKSSPLFEDWQQSFSFLAVKAIYSTAREHFNNLIPLFIILGILALLYFFLPPIAEGAMIQLIARKKNKQDVRTRDGFRYGFATFLPLFNYSWVARSFNFFVIFGEMAFVLRNLGPSAFQTLFPVFILAVFFSIIFGFLFVFTEYHIVIDDRHIAESMAKSAVLAVKHWDVALMVSVLMFLIGIRIILQIIFVLLVPGSVFFLIYFLAASTIPFLGLLAGGAIALVALFLASYLGAVVHVFTTSVWVFTFLELTNTPEVSARAAQPLESIVREE